jgi:hypothetical protein
MSGFSCPRRRHRDLLLNAESEVNSKIMTKVAIVYHSLYGHTKLLADAVFRAPRKYPV